MRCRPPGGPVRRRDADRAHHYPTAHRPGASDRRGGAVRGTAGFRPAGAPASLRLSARIVATGTASRTQVRLPGRLVATGTASHTQLRLPGRLVATGAASHTRLRLPGRLVATGAAARLRLPRARSVATSPAPGCPARGPAGTPLPVTVKPHGGVDRLRGRRGPCARRWRVRRVEVPRPPHHRASVGNGLLLGCREPDRIRVVRFAGGELAQL